MLLGLYGKGIVGREAAVERRCVSHPNAVCPPAEWVKATPEVQVSKCCSLCMEELVVSASRGDCKAGEAGTQSSKVVCPVAVPEAVTAQPGHVFR